jgi:thioredoxin 1
MGVLSKLFGGGEKVQPEHIDTLESFKKVVLESETPVIVDVWSPSCGPCQKMVPVLVNVATKYQGRIRIAEISTEAEPALLSGLGVRATPTLLVYEGGQEVGRMTGFRPEGWFDEMIATEFPDAT